MVSIMKPVIRFGVIAGLAGGAALLVAGPDRVGAALTQARGSINKQIDSRIQDPVALRAQIRKLAEQYPERIASVRSDLAQLQAHTAQVERERQIAERVVALAESDLVELKDMLARAEDANTTGRVVRVSFGGSVMDLDGAYRRANHVLQTRDAYAARLAESDRDLAYMQQQEERLNEILATLEREQAEFRRSCSSWTARSTRWRERASARDPRSVRETIDRHSRYEAASLDQLKGRLGDIRSKQEARMQAAWRTASRARTTRTARRSKLDRDLRGRQEIRTR